MSPAFTQWKIKLPLSYFSSIVPALVFLLHSNNQGQYILKFIVCLVWFSFFVFVFVMRAVKLTFSSHDLCQHLQSLPFCLFYHTKKLALLSHACSPPILWRVYISWYTFGFFYKILFLILPTCFGSWLFDALKKVGSENILDNNLVGQNKNTSLTMTRFIEYAGRCRKTIFLPVWHHLSWR